jgi:hypothetical protein
MGVMNEDRFEDLLREAGRDYHRPPPVPREEMWKAIVAERARRRRGAAPRTWQSAWRWGLGMAAVLLLGIAIGRFLRPREGARPMQSVATSTAASDTGDGLAYRMVAAQYLTRTEILLTGFRADSRSGRVDAQFSAQARGLLGSTRLLLDSPAGRDPRLKRLLEDLELVLAQIALLPATRDTQDVDLINQGIDQRSVLTRLRTAIPSGPAAATRVQGAL